MCKAVYAVIWCWDLGEVCHTFITYEKEAIYVNFKVFFVLVLPMISCCCLVYIITHGQQQEQQQQQQKEWE